MTLCRNVGALKNPLTKTKTGLFDVDFQEMVRVSKQSIHHYFFFFVCFQVIMALYNFISFVPLSKFCLFAITPSHGSSKRSTFLYRSCLQYVMWVCNFLNLLFLLCDLEISTVSFIRVIFLSIFFTCSVHGILIMLL